ncbi:MAG: YggU family protein [Magnetococcales bacterium]|nr:YggU family protein [Magnetococcales bacterium]
MTTALPPWCQWQGDALVMTIQVQPRASRNQIIGLQHDRLKIALTAPPVEGAANQALCQLLAKQLDVANSQVQVIQGAHSREKRVRVNQPSPGRVAELVRSVG